MLLKGVFLMFIGMGIVFLFLQIMVIAIGLQARVVKKFFPEKEDGQPESASARSAIGPEIAAAVAVGLKATGRTDKA